MTNATPNRQHESKLKTWNPNLHSALLAARLKERPEAVGLKLQPGERSPRAMYTAKPRGAYVSTAGDKAHVPRTEHQPPSNDNAGLTQDVYREITWTGRGKKP